MKKFRVKAVMDKRTCSKCVSLDGKVISEEQIKEWGPPHHTERNDPIYGNCRCVLEEIEKIKETE